MKRPVVYTINAMLVLVILGLILATWMPAIYSSHWFQENHWVRAHVLDNLPAPRPAGPARVPKR